jgi:hypothetical protein
MVEVFIRISELKGSPKWQENPGTQINGKCNVISSAGENE